MNRTSWVLPSGGMFLAVTAAALAAYAEGVGSDAQGASSADRLIAAATVLPAGDDGLVALGGPALRRLTRGSRRWETVHAVPGDHSYRVAADPSGRLLAAWSKEPLIHFFAPAQKQHLWFPKPAVPGTDVTGLQVADLAFAPNGREALVFMSGYVQVNTGAFRGPSWSTAVYRAALDGKSEARLIFRLDHGYPLHTSRFGAVFAMPKNPGQQCNHSGCSIGAIVAYEISGDGVKQKTLLDGEGRELRRARLVRGSNDERIALMLDAAKPNRLELLRWRYGDPHATFRTLPGAASDDQTALLLTRTDELVEFRRGGNLLQVLRHGTSTGGAETLATLGALQSADTGLYGFGERSAGGFWVHWGDHLGLVSPDQPPRSFSLQALLPRRCDWAGDIPIQATPEHLWVGLDCRGRDYARVSFADAERRAKPWPADDQTGVVGTGGEGAVSYARDPSTSGRLFGVTGLRAVPGGLISVGGATLRRLTPGASRWEVLHEVRGDNLYRVAADDSGRLLASWETDPFIHLFSPEQRQHVSLPKPTLFFSFKGEQFNALHVESLAFAANGRDALVFSRGQVGVGARSTTAAHWIALDGRSEPRLIFRVDQGLELLTSRRGAVFAMPRDARQECSHQTCWPIAAIVAYEIAGDRVTQRTLLDGDRADMARASLVFRGSGDERVGLVLDLIMRRGPQRLNGGRALLRWSWGDATPDYRSLPGNSTVVPTWLLTTTSDFIEVVHKYDVEPERLEIRRFPLGNGEPITTTLGPLEHRPTPHGVGERSDGGLWLQWGDHLGLLSPGKPPRSYNLDPLVQHGWEWADALIYVKTPESLWVGLDGRGRQYVRVDLAEAERRSQIWR